MTSPPLPVDHRSRTAARRREAMRQRLIEAAVIVFARAGDAEAPVIEDVIREAGVARGSFYKYFPSYPALLRDAHMELGEEILSMVASHLDCVEDPAEIAARGIGLFIATARTYPAMARFAAHAGLGIEKSRTPMLDYMVPYLESGIARGRFVDQPLTTAFDLVKGAIMFCLIRAEAAGAHDRPPDAADAQHLRHVVAGILRGLGVSAEEAWALADQRPAALSPPADSLLARSHMRLSNPPEEI